MTHTYAVLQVSATVYDEVKQKLEAAGYSHAFHTHEGEPTPTIDMHGIGLTRGAEDEGRVAKLTEALRLYGRHLRECDVVTQPHPRYNPCSCGLDTLRRP